MGNSLFANIQVHKLVADTMSSGFTLEVALEYVWITLCQLGTTPIIMLIKREL